MSTLHRVKELRLFAQKIMGRRIRQIEASELAGLSEKVWHSYESGHRHMPDEVLSLFCERTGIRFRPTMLDDDKPFEAESPGDAIGVNVGYKSSSFIRVNRSGGGPIVLNKAHIVSVSYAIETKDVQIDLVGGVTVRACDAFGSILEALEVSA